jgi:hypothetical protein
VQLAIDILRSELGSYRQCLRTEDKYSVYPEYRGPNVDFRRNIADLQEAIAHLQKAMEQNRHIDQQINV